MPVNNKPIEAVDEYDLQAMVLNQVRENRTLEYKAELPKKSGKEKDKWEFLADVSAFANTLGGDLVYGVRENKGIASEVCGLELDNVDQECLTLQNIIQTGLDPRIPRVLIQPIPLANERTVILLRIPRSWALPHMVRDSSKFYGRNSNGKYPLDAREIRAAFLSSETITERIRGFRDDRLKIIARGDAPIDLTGSGGYLVLHVIPIEAFDIASQFDVTSLVNNFPKPLSASSGAGRRINFDGLLSFDIFKDRSSTHSYIQTFRNGIIEAVDTTSTTRHNSDTAYIDPGFQRDVLAGLRGILAAQQRLGVEPPLFVGLSFLGVKDYCMWVDQRFSRHRNEPIDRDNLLVPEVVIEDYDTRLVDLMKPAFDTVWNACGWNQSLHYDSEGKWTGGAF